MTDMNREYDVAVIGAGAAGIAAARLLQEHRVDALLVEARDRVGGRAWTVPGDGGFAIDLGCEWLHSADVNPWTRIARELGFTLDTTAPDWGSRVAWFEGEAAQRDWQRAMAAFYDRLDAAAAGPEDRAASTLLEPGNRWNALLGAISNWANGAELDRVSALDYGRYDPSNVNWRVLEGYGALIARQARGLPVALETVVERIEHGGKRARLVTNRGDITARAVIVALPASIIAEERVGFSPALPGKAAAARGLPLGSVNKLFLRLDGDHPKLAGLTDRHLIGALDRVKTGSYQIRPHGWPVIACFYGGELSVELERAGIAAMADFAAQELAGLFGSAIKPMVAPLAASAWTDDPFARGSYSMALPGHADAREVLAAPVNDRLFFAGEACSLPHFGTAHGALLSGETAARAALAALSADRTPLASRAAPSTPAGT